MNKIPRKERDMHYPIKSFRLANDLTDLIAKLKRESDKSYNLLFWDMVAAYQKHKKLKKNNEKEEIKSN